LSKKVYNLYRHPPIQESRALKSRKKSSAHWEFNFNYWSGGIVEQPSNNAVWCPHNTTVLLSAVAGNFTVPALSAVPNCMRLKITDRTSKTYRTVSWSFKNCSMRFFPACMVLISCEQLSCGKTSNNQFHSRSLQRSLKRIFVPLAKEQYDKIG
jgi:hypothetical protein